MAKNDICIFLTQQGFMAGRKNANGTLQLGAHKISEDEILTMASTLLRTYQAKTGEDTLIVPAAEDKLMVMKLMEIKGQDSAEQKPAAASAAPAKKKRTRKAKKAE